MPDGKACGIFRAANRSSLLENGRNSGARTGKEALAESPAPARTVFSFPPGGLRPARKAPGLFAFTAYIKIRKSA